MRRYLCMQELRMWVQLQMYLHSSKVGMYELLKKNKDQMTTDSNFPLRAGCMIYVLPPQGSTVR